MQNIDLLLTTPHGDELGRLPLPGVAVAAAGEASAAARPRLDEEMGDLQERIRRAVTGEGMTVALDEIDLRIVLSRALLQGADGERITIALPVKETPSGTETPDSPTGNGADPLVDDLDDLFNLDDVNEGGDNA